MSKPFDVTVIGSGPAGYVAAIRAAQLGLRVAIVEREFWGGVCLNVGCIPTKALLKNAEVAHTLQNRGREFGFSFDNLRLDYGVAFRRSRQVSERLVKGVQYLLKQGDITPFEGTGTIAGRDAVRVALKEDGEETIATDHIIVSTGARPRGIPGVTIDGTRVVTYTEAILAPELPRSVVIIGAGPIGVEFAYIWRNYGVEVTVVEMLDRLLPLEDAEASDVVAKAYRRLKIDVLTGSLVESVSTSDDDVQVKVRKNGATTELRAEKALVAIGFRPNVEGIGLESVGVVPVERGEFVRIDDQMRTNIPNIYAIGDVTGKMMLAHVGSAMGIIAAEAIAGQDPPGLDYLMMPRCVYCQPQVASFGYTEEQAREKGLDLQIGRFPFLANGKALGLGERDGLVKIISDAVTGELLGAHLVGPDVTELLPELTLARSQELTAAEISRNVHAHPTLSEAIMEAAHAVEGHAIHI
jgi:dihydrolipoamide dehydrogenase